MTDQERLEEIKQDVKMTRKDLAVSPSNEMTLHLDIMLDYMDYLIEQAERVQELEEQKLALIEEMGQVDERFLDLEQQNKKLREALKEIASDDSWETVDEVRSIAYVALESE